MKNISKKIMYGGLAAGVLVAPIASTVSCARIFPRLSDMGGSSADANYTIHLDAYYKFSPLFKNVISAVEKKINDKGLGKFTFKYTEQDTESFTKDKIVQLGFMDPQVPDVFKLEYGDISAFNNIRALMPFDEKMAGDLHLDVLKDKSSFTNLWGSEGVDRAIRRDEFNREGRRTGNQVIVGMPFSINSSVMMVRNGVNFGEAKKRIDASNVNNSLEYLKKITFNDTVADPNVTADTFADPEQGHIPAKYVEQFKFTKSQLTGAGTLVVDQYGKKVYILTEDKTVDGHLFTKGTIIRYQEKNGINGFLVNGNPCTDAEVNAKFGNSIEQLKTATPTFFTRMDLWNELGQFLASAAENDKKDGGNRVEFFWKQVEHPTTENDWKHLFNEEWNHGAAKIWRYLYDSVKIQTTKDESWFDPNQATDTSFYNMTHGSRNFPITGIWDLGIAERKYAEFVFGLGTDSDYFALKSAAASNPDIKKEFDRIVDQATKTLPLNDFIGANNLNLTPFMQVGSLVVNNRIAMNPKKWNPSVKGNDGKSYSKKDVIEMIFDEFNNPVHAGQVIETQMMSPVNKNLRDAIKNSTSINTKAFNPNNYREYVDAQEKILQNSPAGPKIQFYYNVQDAGQRAITTDRDLATTIQSSIGEIRSKIAQQQSAGIDRAKDIYQNSGTGLTPAGEDDERFHYWYNLIQDKMWTLVKNQWKLLSVSGKEFY